MTTITKTLIGAGSLTKMEKLREINSKLFNTTVLEVEEPYPGYYHEVPQDKAINSIFLLIRSRFFPEHVLRATNIVKKSLDIDFEAAYSRLTFHKRSTFVAIRLINIKKYEDIKLIQQAYSDAGIDFEAEMKCELKAPAILNINKVFVLNSVADGIYTNDEMEHTLYLELENGGNWEWFEKVTYRVKNNFSRSNFDAAHAVVFQKGSLIELVRIFDDKISLEEAMELKKLYNNYS